MSTLIFRTMAPLLCCLMALFSLFILLRGHNDPGGGFIGGLIAAAAIAIYAMAFSVHHAREVLRLHPLAYAGVGVLAGGVAGLASLISGAPFLTGIWLPGYHFGTPGLFDIGVYLAVFGTLAEVTLALEDRGNEP
ncbi:MAG: MnhB domain-containing protein [Devosia sp.]